MLSESSSSATKTAVHFGAGNIGRGFIGPLLSDAGYHVSFIDRKPSVVHALNTEDVYHVHVLDSDEQRQPVYNFSGIVNTDPATVEAIANADIVTTSVGPSALSVVAPAIAKGLSKRRMSNNSDTKVTIIACENMIGNTSALREHVESALEGMDDDLEYLDSHVGWPNCEVDRIVPPFRGNDLLTVGVEGFYEWVVEKNEVMGDLDVDGMLLKDNLDPFLERKLFTLNCGHAITSYLGSLKGYKTIDAAIGDAEIKRVVRAAIEESGAALIAKHGFNKAEHQAYVETTMTRYANPNLHDEVMRVGRSPLRKLSPKERLVGSVRMANEFGLPRDNLLKGIASVFFFTSESDAEAVELQKLVKEKGMAAAVEQTTTFKQDSEEHRTILREFDALKKWRTRSNL